MASKKTSKRGGAAPATKQPAASGETTPSSAKGLKGYGSLRGLLKIDPRVDLSKPIAAQVARWKA